MAILTPKRLRVGAVALGLVFAALLGVSAAVADPIGTQARVSFQGPGSGTGSAAHDAVDPAIAYNSRRNTYLIVWSGDTATAGEDEIWARLVAADGTLIGRVQRVSNMGPAGNLAFDARQPKVAYNASIDEYLVVWHGDHDVGTMSGEEEIWGRRINGDGTFASDQFQISEMGANGSASYEGLQPDVVYNAHLNQYVVVWRGDQPAPGDGEDEIWARRLNPDGTSIDADEVRVSDIGPPGAAFDALQPEIAYDSDARQYLVVFHGDDGNNEEFEIHGQLLGQGLKQVGANDFLLSDTPDAAGDARSPEVAYNAVAKRFLVVWRANKIAAAKTEIYAQLLDGSGAAVGADDLRVSTTGPGGDPDYDAFQAMVVSHERAAEFLVSWYGDVEDPGLAENENEIYARPLTGNGVPVGASETRVSTMGAEGDAAYNAFGLIGGAYNARDNEYLLGWEADDDAGGLLDNEYEIYSRRFGAAAATAGQPANCKPVPPGPAPKEKDQITKITARQLRINQAIGAAAIRRSTAIDTWLNDGILTKDLCGAALGPEDFDPNVTTATGPLGPTPPQADPRPLSIPRAQKKPGVTFAVTRIQVCINQRIYQKAIAQANALEKRIRGGLTGGDITDANVTQGLLQQNLSVTASTTNPNPPARSETKIIKPSRKGCQNVKVTAAQAAINSKIAVTAVKRVNSLRAILARGLTGGNFADQTITKVDLAPGVSP